MARIRVGIFGNYYGSLFSESRRLTNSEMQLNANYIRSYLTAEGWTLNAIAGLLGNAQHESALNPGRWQSDNVGSTSSGYGLTQWTPASKYISWCNDTGRVDPSEMDNNLARLIYEVGAGVQYYKTPDYDYNFEEFTHSTKSPYELACAFAFNYERSWTVLYGTEAEKEVLRQKRGNSANYWYEFLSGENPTFPDDGEGGEGGSTDTTRKRAKFNFILLNAKRRRNTWKNRTH